MSLEDLESRNSSFDLNKIQAWVEKYDGVNGRFRFFQAYMPLSPFVRQIAKPLLSMKTCGSMDTERAAKPVKDLILSKKRNRLSHRT